MVQVSHISFSESGGAGIVATRLRNEQRRKNQDSVFLTLTKGDIKTLGLKRPLLLFLALIDYYIVKKSSCPTLFTLFRSRTPGKKIYIEKFDHQLLHLHWTPGVVSHRDIRSFSNSNIPIVWTLHDMWPITGGCHHALDCEQFKESCKKCPQVRRVFRPLVHLQQRKKKRLFETSKNIKFVAPSKWILVQLLESSIPLHKAPVLILNPIDMDVFKPGTTRRPAMAKFNIGFVANKLDDPLKNVKSTIAQLLKWVEDAAVEDIRITLVGSTSVNFGSELIEIQHIPKISSELEMAEIYNTFDVLLHNSLIDNSPLVIQEALSCGIPVICSEAGGSKFLIEDSHNGFVVNDISEITERITQLKNDRMIHKQMKTSARSHALANFSLRSITDKYQDVYESFDKPYD